MIVQGGPDHPPFFFCISVVHKINAYPDASLCLRFCAPPRWHELQWIDTMSERTFTLPEAQELLPVLESLLHTAIEGKKLIESVDNELQELAHRVFLRGGVLVNVVQMARRKAEREKTIQRVKDALAEIDATGVQVKDLDIGLLDFPCEVDGRTVLLCWKLGEQGITHWHGVSEGFAGRKPIDQRIANAKRAH